MDLETFTRVVIALGLLVAIPMVIEYVGEFISDQLSRRQRGIGWWKKGYDRRWARYWRKHE